MVLGASLDLAAFAVIWLVTVGFSRLGVPLTRIPATTWFWLWITGFGMALIGIVLSSAPSTRRTGLAILVALPIPAIIGMYLTS